MSEPIPESIPTSHDPRSKRPTKKRALTPVSSQAATLNALFANPDREVDIPSSSTLTSAAQPSAPEIVSNVQGSSAGAGSGEFHVYKASRRREYERLRAMDEEVAKEEDSVRFAREKEERENKDRERTRKNREKRDKMKMRKEKKGTPATGEGLGVKIPKVVPRTIGARTDEDEGRATAGIVDEGSEPQGLIIHDDD